jgi:hypothetical protein
MEKTTVCKDSDSKLIRWTATDGTLQTMKTGITTCVFCKKTEVPCVILNTGVCKDCILYSLERTGFTLDDQEKFLLEKKKSIEKNLDAIQQTRLRYKDMKTQKKKWKSQVAQIEKDLEVIRTSAATSVATAASAAAIIGAISEVSPAKNE